MFREDEQFEGESGVARVLHVHGGHVVQLEERLELVPRSTDSATLNITELNKLISRIPFYLTKFLPTLSIQT